MPPAAEPADSFELFDLRVEVVGPLDRRIFCGAKLGDYFELHGEMLLLPPGQGFSIYSLAALLPLLPAKQRPSDPVDWMSTDAEVACPDPHCPTRFRITRTGRRRFERSAVTAVAATAGTPTGPGVNAAVTQPGGGGRTAGGGGRAAGGGDRAAGGGDG